MSWDFQTEPEFQLLRDMKPAESASPSEHVPARRAAAMANYADVLARVQAGG
jgi:hypothetical protein